MTLMDSQGSDSPEMDVDALIEQVNAPATERPMSGEEAPAPEQAAPAAQAAPQTPQEYEYEWSGRKIKEPLEMILKRAGMGYDYAQRMEALKREQGQMAEKYKPYEKYKTIDDYVQKDPAWWQHVEESWNDRLASEDPTVQRVKALLDEQLQPVKALLSQKEEQEQQAKVDEEDNRLDKDIKSIREKYKDLDFDTPDAQGKSLEMKVLEHGSTNGFPSFKAAFLDFHHEQLEKMWESRGREAIGKEAEKRQKLGLSGTPRTPQKTSDAFDTRGDWNDVMKQVTERYGL